MDAGHRYFHENMVRNVSIDMGEEEKRILIEGINNLSKFLYRKLDEIEETNAKKVAEAMAKAETEASGDTE